MHKVAHLAVTALRDVYGAPHPGFLTVEAYDTEGNAVAVPDLQFEPTPDAPAVDEGTAAPLLLRPTDPEELRRAVHASLTRLLQADEIVVDDDGDIPIRWGSAALYVRVLDDHPIVRIFSPILTDIVITPQVREAVNEVNRDRPLVSAMWIDDTVILVADVFVAAFSEDNFVNVMHDVSAVAAGVARRYLQTAGDDDSLDLAAVTDEDLLRRLNVVDGEGRLTNAGSLLFVGTPQVGLDYIRRDVPGGDSTNRVASDRPLLEQVWDVDRASQAANRIVHRAGGFAHGQRRALPARAAREAIVNGAVHRDWLSPQPTNGRAHRRHAHGDLAGRLHRWHLAVEHHHPSGRAPVPEPR